MYITIAGAVAFSIQLLSLATLFDHISLFTLGHPNRPYSSSSMLPAPRKAVGQPSGEPLAKKRKANCGIASPRGKEPLSALPLSAGMESKSSTLPVAPVVNRCDFGDVPCPHAEVSCTSNVINDQLGHESDLDGIAVEIIEEDEAVVHEPEEPLRLLHLGSSRRATSLHPA
ncbi:hypothetical protein FRB94_000514 [Tulasnella sp. JGI-2019a]|nr:hypothetical protein FRB93_010536 [Tulasnella sp. JGI-2019a]KAG9006679.1 hypothetical protein FRB94_000514 [Tulasnella sp. JGI-2019a]KAG9039056.1 hypothetical protein FRB95_012767 [Tulasnella sp. JGI-2019a]